MTPRQPSEPVWITIEGAADILGITEKRLKVYLGSGRIVGLRGERRRWIAAEYSSLLRHKRRVRPYTRSSEAQAQPRCPECGALSPAPGELCALCRALQDRPYYYYRDCYPVPVSSMDSCYQCHCNK